LNCIYLFQAYIAAPYQLKKGDFMTKNQNNNSTTWLSLIGQTVALNVGFASHCIAFLTERAIMVGLTKVPYYYRTLLSRGAHELVEHSITAGVSIQMNNGTSILDAVKGIPRALLENPIEALASSASSICVEHTVSKIVGLSEDAPLISSTSFVRGILSGVGGRLGAGAYEWLSGTTAEEQEKEL
jgi:hypothetical protein